MRCFCRPDVTQTIETTVRRTHSRRECVETVMARDRRSFVVPNQMGGEELARPTAAATEPGREHP
ncbi:hypothetical protein BH24ACT15_BH24ACT15_37220 [soil metagenome]